MSITKPCKGVLFDLDGTLIDTAADLANALNLVLIENKQPTLSFEQIRPVVSHGGLALIQRGFAHLAEDFDFEALRLRLLDFYQANICEKTCLFPQLDELLQQLEQANIAWGIVTNKPQWLTQPLLEKLALTERVQALVCGDTLSVRKPHPQPIIHACQEMRRSIDECIYIGDAKRDIEAAQAAGMRSVAAAYGYIEADDPPQHWQADKIIDSPEQLWPYIQSLL